MACLSHGSEAALVKSRRKLAADDQRLINLVDNRSLIKSTHQPKFGISTTAGCREAIDLAAD
jgi:hypothetical protein